MTRIRTGDELLREISERVRSGAGDPSARRSHQVRLMELTGSWATACLLSGLLRHAELCALLERGADLVAVAAASGLGERQARALLDALVAEDLLLLDAGEYRFSPYGLDAVDFRGWLDLFVQGYGDFFNQAGRLWRGALDGIGRNMAAIGTASNAMSAHDAVPLVLGAIDRVRPDACRLLDVGCADGLGVATMCEERAGWTAMGVEPDPTSAEAARRLVTARGLDGRVRIVNGEIGDVPLEPPPDVIVFSFVLQELLGQYGEAYTRQLLRSLGERWPSSTVMVVEVDADGQKDLGLMRSSPQRRGYYRLYYVVHELTAQRLLTFDDWRRLFAEVGYTIETETVCDHGVDDSDLTVCFALRWSNHAHSGPPQPEVVVG